MRAEIILTSFLIIAVILSSGCNTYMELREAGTFVASPSCSWVFRTKADYSDRIAVSLVRDRSRVTHVPFFKASIQSLDQGYYTAVSGCEYPEDWIIAFTSVTVDEWEQSQEECWEQRAAEAAESDTQKTSRETGAVSGIQPVQIGDRLCDSGLFFEVMNNFQEYVTEDDPFTELYICEAPPRGAEELNSLISSGGLATVCEEQIF